jgi:hypothetical protein
MTFTLRSSGPPGTVPGPSGPLPAEPGLYPAGRPGPYPPACSGGPQAVPVTAGQAVPGPSGRAVPGPRPSPATPPYQPGASPGPAPAAGLQPAAAASRQEHRQALLRFWRDNAAARWQPWRQDPFGAALDLLWAQPESLAAHHCYSIRSDWIPGDCPGFALLRVIGIAYHLLIATPVMAAAAIASALASRPSRLAGAVLFTVLTRAVVALLGHL